MNYEESIKSFSMMLEAINRDSLSTKGKEQYDKNKVDAKKFGGKQLAKLEKAKKNTQKEFHMLSPSEKIKARKAMGFNSAKKKQVGKVIIGSGLDPDYFIDDDGKNTSKTGGTFIYDLINDILINIPYSDNSFTFHNDAWDDIDVGDYSNITANGKKMTDRIVHEYNLRDRFWDGSPSEFLNGRYGVIGSRVEIDDPDYDDAKGSLKNISKGDKILSLWDKADNVTLSIINKRIGINFDSIHMPSK